MSEDRLAAATEWVTGRVAPPPPREADDRIVTGVITAGWAVVLAVLGGLAAAGVLPADQRWWLWTCAAGLCMGLFGLWYVPVLKHRRARAAAGAGAQPSSGPSGSSGSSGPSSESRESGSNTVSSTETPGNSTRS